MAWLSKFRNFTESVIPDGFLPAINGTFDHSEEHIDSDPTIVPISEATALDYSGESETEEYIGDHPTEYYPIDGSEYEQPANEDADTYPGSEDYYTSQQYEYGNSGDGETYDSPSTHSTCHDSNTYGYQCINTQIDDGGFIYTYNDNVIQKEAVEKLPWSVVENSTSKDCVDLASTIYYQENPRMTRCFEFSFQNNTYTSYYTNFCQGDQWGYDPPDGQGFWQQQQWTIDPNSTLGINSISSVSHSCVDWPIFEMYHTCETDLAQHQYTRPGEYWGLIHIPATMKAKHVILWISVTSLLVASVILLYFKKLRTTKSKIHVQLFMAFIIRGVVIFVYDYILTLFQTLFLENFMPELAKRACKSYFEPRQLQQLKIRTFEMLKTKVHSEPWQFKFVNYTLQHVSAAQGKPVPQNSTMTDLINQQMYTNGHSNLYTHINEFFFLPHRYFDCESAPNDTMQCYYGCGNPDNPDIQNHECFRSYKSPDQKYGSSSDIQQFYQADYLNYLNHEVHRLKTQQRGAIQRDIFHCQLKVPSWLITLEKTMTIIEKYTYLAWHIWVLMEAVNLYILLKHAFARKKGFLLKMSLFAWLTPAFITLCWVVATAILIQPTDETCEDGSPMKPRIWYLSNSQGTRSAAIQQHLSWIFNGPILLMWIANFVLFVSIMNVLVAKVRKDNAEQKAMNMHENFGNMNNRVNKKLREHYASVDTTHTETGDEPQTGDNLLPDGSKIPPRKDSAYESQSTDGASRRESRWSGNINFRRLSRMSVHKLTHIFDHPVYKVARATFLLVVLFGLYDLLFILINPKAYIVGSVETGNSTQPDISVDTSDEQLFRTIQALGQELFGLLVAIAYCYANAEVLTVLRTHYKNKSFY